MRSRCWPRWPRHPRDRGDFVQHAGQSHDDLTTTPPSNRVAFEPGGNRSERQRSIAAWASRVAGTIHRRASGAAHGVGSHRIQWRVWNTIEDVTTDAVKNTWLISSDESGTGGQEFYGFGSLWMPYERRGTFYGDFMDIRRRHRLPDNHEVKWSKLDGHTRRVVALDLIDWFFQRPWLMFHCLVVRKADVDRSHHDGSFDLALRKHFVMLLVNKMKQCARAHTDRANVFRIWVDPIASSYKKADEAAHVIAKNTLRQMFTDQEVEVESVVTRDSKATPTIQLCDLLLGAVMDAWQGSARKQEKRDVARQIATYLGWDDLRSDTFSAERKFNIWYFYDRRKPRPVVTRQVQLKYPLPVRRDSPAAITIASPRRTAP